MNSMRGNQRPKYRPDIDGLRAVAVLLVVCNHFMRIHCTGGYIGVDVFFVISGYLISQTILGEMDAGQFSIVNFYERRIRRIFPALFVMMVIVSFLVYKTFLPSLTISYGYSLLASLFSVSNFLFSHQAGYFSAASDTKPLLHTWSLAVEEQFYLIFPVFLLGVRRYFPRQLKIALYMTALISFLLAAACIYINAKTTAFFFSPMRAWEFIVGALGSQGYLLTITGRLRKDAASLIGLVMIVVPAFFYTDITAFPGVAALPPCVGTILIILAGESGLSFVGKILSWRPVVFIGLISYSLYLWHWPIKVFIQTQLITVDVQHAPNPHLVLVTMFVTSCVLGIISWHFVETSFRRGSWRPARRPLFVVSAIGALAITAIALAMTASRGLPERFPSAVDHIDAYASADPTEGWRSGQCFLTAATDFSGRKTFEKFDKKACLEIDGKNQKHYLIYGDSHAADKYFGLVKIFPEISFSEATVSDCQPLLAEPLQSSTTCMEMSQYIFKDYLVAHQIDGLVLGGAWRESELPELTRTIEYLKNHGIHVIVFGPAIQYNLPFPRLLALALWKKEPDSFFDAHLKLEEELLDEKMSMLAKSVWQVPYISEYSDLCGVKKADHVIPTSHCPIYSSIGVPLLQDTDHLTLGGSVLFAQTLRETRELE